MRGCGDSVGLGSVGLLRGPTSRDFDSRPVLTHALLDCAWRLGHRPASRQIKRRCRSGDYRTRGSAARKEIGRCYTAKTRTSPFEGTRMPWQPPGGKSETRLRDPSTREALGAWRVRSSISLAEMGESRACSTSNNSHRRKQTRLQTERSETKPPTQQRPAPLAHDGHPASTPDSLRPQEFVNLGSRPLPPAARTDRSSHEPPPSRIRRHDASPHTRYSLLSLGGTLRSWFPGADRYPRPADRCNPAQGGKVLVLFPGRGGCRAGGRRWSGMQSKQGTGTGLGWGPCLVIADEEGSFLQARWGSSVLGGRLGGLALGVLLSQPRRPAPLPESGLLGHASAAIPDDAVQTTGRGGGRVVRLRLSHMPSQVWD